MRLIPIRTPSGRHVLRLKHNDLYQPNNHTPRNVSCEQLLSRPPTGHVASAVCAAALPRCAGLAGGCVAEGVHVRRPGPCGARSHGEWAQQRCLSMGLSWSCCHNVSHRASNCQSSKGKGLWLTSWQLCLKVTFFDDSSLRCSLLITRLGMLHAFSSARLSALTITHALFGTKSCIHQMRSSR